jgi:hypothetical protein
VFYSCQNAALHTVTESSVWDIVILSDADPEDFLIARRRLKGGV